MHFELDDKYLEVRAQARAFADAIEDIAAEADEMSEVHPGVLGALRDSGLSGLMVPAEYGGRFERVDPLAICLAREAIMATSAHADSLFALQGIGSFAITLAGSEEQRRR
ncbi:MAG: acyl-CoA dehydrogenase, partial [Gammaproteobacteria bacterium]|nr:acyl-CoA dehydrogenase [Gammaproteobacteria bacterium]